MQSKSKCEIHNELGSGETQRKLIQAFGDSLTFETPRYVETCNIFGLTLGVILDIRKGWIFGEQDDRLMILEQVRWEKPMLIAGADRGSPKRAHVQHVKFLNEFVQHEDVKRRLICA